MRGHHGQHAAGGKRQWVISRRGLSLCYPILWVLLPSPAGTVTSASEHTAVLLSTGTTQWELLCPAAWLCVLPQSLQDWELLCAGASWPSHNSNTEQQESSELLQWGNFHSQLNTTYHLPAHTAPGCSASCQVSLQTVEHLLKKQVSCFACEWYLGLQGWLKCESLTAVPPSTSTIVQSEQFPGPDWCSSSTSGANTSSMARTDWLL